MDQFFEEFICLISCKGIMSKFMDYRQSHGYYSHIEGYEIDNAGKYSKLLIQSLVVIIVLKMALNFFYGHKCPNSRLKAKMVVIDTNTHNSNSRVPNQISLIFFHSN